MSNPILSPRQAAAVKAQGTDPDIPVNCLVTGGTGFVGQRLVEMLVERGAKRVVSFDIVPPPKEVWKNNAIEYIVGDISDREAVVKACAGIDCVWHLAAAVGPFHPQELYKKINYEGTLNVLEGCKQNGVKKLVMSSSPSTRFDGTDIDGLTEADMPELPLKSYMQAYAETKALGEMAVTAACSDEFMTVSVAPHQVYGPRDNLFLPNVLEAGRSGMLRIFSHPRTGYGKNRVCFTHVDNYAHGLILGAKALYKGSPALGKFYIVTDGNTHPFPEGYTFFWDSVDEAIKGMGFTSIWSKFKLPYWFLMPAAYVANGISYVIGKPLKLNPFNVKVLCMHRWFNISAAETDLKFKPIIPFNEGWEDTIEWFKLNWLPKVQSSKGLSGIAQQSQAKIDIQAEGNPQK